MMIERLVVGELQENCYIGTIGDNSFIIDPGDDANRIIEACKNKNIVEILITHYHFDHIGALDEIKKYFGIDENKKSGCFDYDVILTPGHTIDSRCYYFKNEKIMFTGDFIFFHTIGRTDLPSGCDADMRNSLELISEYSNDIIIYPGHGPETVLGVEKEMFKYYY